MQAVRVERLDHLGMVAGVCQEMGVAAYLDALAGPSQQQVSVGKATVAMILNGLGFSNRRLYLVSQFFATKPVEHLLGPGITAEMLHDDCLGRTLDWLYAHDPTALFAGIARQARRRFGIAVRQVHVDTTSFSVSGAYELEEAEGEAQVIAVTYGYSRDHRGRPQAMDAGAGHHAAGRCASVLSDLRWPRQRQGQPGGGGRGADRATAGGSR
jgi:transposase